jgi:hypothetical protein
MTTPHFVYSTKEIYVLMVLILVADGTLHLMVQNVQNQGLLKEFSTFYPPKSTPIVTATLQATVTKFLKVTYVWGSG